jgi:hypothetical protein
MQPILDGKSGLVPTGLLAQFQKKDDWTDRLCSKRFALNSFSSTDNPCFEE